MSSTNGRCNSAERGSSRARRARRAWLLTEAAGWGGDGETVPCWDCGVILWFEDLYVDRIIPGERGGTYARDNIAPHCGPCSCRQGQLRTTEIRALRGFRVRAGLHGWDGVELAPEQKLPGYPPFFEAALADGY